MKPSLISIFLSLLLSASCSLPGAGASEQIVPDTTRAGEPAVVTIVFSVWGSGGPVKGRYKDIVFYYRLVGETNYKSLQPEPVALPTGYDYPDNRDTHETYRVTIPAYPKGTTGDIEFYFEKNFDGYQSRTDGLKKIHVL
jgi:hypothetical protein